MGRAANRLAYRGKATWKSVSVKSGLQRSYEGNRRGLQICTGEVTILNTLPGKLGLLWIILY